MTLWHVLVSSAFLLFQLVRASLLLSTAARSSTALKHQQLLDQNDPLCPLVSAKLNLYAILAERHIAVQAAQTISSLTT